MTHAYFRKGFGLKQAIEGELRRDYYSALVESIKDRGHRLEVGDLVFRLAREFGFCYGVDRAVEYAYETRTKFPDRRIFLVGEIIHNPHVNSRLRDMGITFLYREPAGEFAFASITPGDVVVLPAFGVTVTDFERLRALGCVLVDTTCGSVLNVWKRVESYARDGFTALIHGKHYHEETKATASQAMKHPSGRYLIVRDMAEAELACDHIERNGDAAVFLTQFGHAVSNGFDPDQHLVRVGVANQTTMLSRESLAIAARVREAMARRYGAEQVEEHFRSFDTICSATQERQDAVLELIGQPLDVMVVIGGYNSSNTTNLAAICAERVPTYHIEDALCIVPDRGAIRHRPVGRDSCEVEREEWLPTGPVAIGLTAGASTPNSKIGETIERICATRGLTLEMASG